MSITMKGSSLEWRATARAAARLAVSCAWVVSGSCLGWTILVQRAVQLGFLAVDGGNREIKQEAWGKAISSARCRHIIRQGRVKYQERRIDKQIRQAKMLCDVV